MTGRLVCSASRWASLGISGIMRASASNSCCSRWTRWLYTDTHRRASSSDSDLGSSSWIGRSRSAPSQAAPAVLSPGGHGYILDLSQSDVTTDHVEFHRGDLYYQTRSCLAPPGPGRAGVSAGPRLRRTDRGSHPSPSLAAPCADVPVQ